jgi:hypothetical protein
MKIGLGTIGRYISAAQKTVLIDLIKLVGKFKAFFTKFFRARNSVHPSFTSAGLKPVPAHNLLKGSLANVNRQATAYQTIATQTEAGSYATVAAQTTSATYLTNETQTAATDNLQSQELGEAVQWDEWDASYDGTLALADEELVESQFVLEKLDNLSRQIDSDIEKAAQEGLPK